MSSSGTCQDLAYSAQCQQLAALNQCGSSVGTHTVSYYCQKSCGLCSGQSSVGTLTCSNLVQNCGTGTCVATQYYGISSIRCACSSSKAGTYCTNGTVLLITLILNNLSELTLRLKVNIYRFKENLILN